MAYPGPPRSAGAPPGPPRGPGQWRQPPPSAPPQIHGHQFQPQRHHTQQGGRGPGHGGPPHTHARPAAAHPRATAPPTAQWGHGVGAPHHQQHRAPRPAVAGNFGRPPPVFARPPPVFGRPPPFTNPPPMRPPGSQPPPAPPATFAAGPRTTPNNAPGPVPPSHGRLAPASQPIQPAASGAARPSFGAPAAQAQRNGDSNGFAPSGTAGPSLPASGAGLRRGAPGAPGRRGPGPPPPSFGAAAAAQPSHGRSTAPPPTAAAGPGGPPPPTGAGAATRGPGVARSMVPTYNPAAVAAGNRRPGSQAPIPAGSMHGGPPTGSAAAAGGPPTTNGRPIAHARAPHTAARHPAAAPSTARPAQPPPAPPGGAQPPAGLPSNKPRVNPNLVPRPTHPQPFSVYNTDCEIPAPPLSSSNYVVVDRGHCNPRFMRTTVNVMPSTPDVLDRAKVPIVAVTTPLAAVGQGEESVRAVDFGADGPLRCSRCRAYINPYCQFIDNGAKFECNICSFENAVPPAYYCPLDQYGFRRDRHEKAELSRGSVEFLIPPAYSKPPGAAGVGAGAGAGAGAGLGGALDDPGATSDAAPSSGEPCTPPAYVFVVDVSYHSVSQGVLESTLAAIRDSVAALADDFPHTRFGLLAYHESVFFFNCHPNRSSLQVCVMGDMDDPFAPLPPPCWLPAVADAREQIEELLTMLPTLFAGDGRLASSSKRRVTRSGVGAAVAAAVAGLGGVKARLMVVQAAIPTVGVGSLNLSRERVKLYGTDDEQSLYAPAKDDTFYAQLADKCCEAGCCVELFAAASGFLDLATVGQLATRTGGTIHRFPEFVTHASGVPHSSVNGATPVQGCQRLVEELRHAVGREVGFDAVWKLRTSKGVGISQVVGNQDMRVKPEYRLAGVDSDSAVTIYLRHEGHKLEKGQHAFLQFALLYTNRAGQRRIRVHNLALPVVDNETEVFRHADAEAVLNTLVKTAVAKVHTAGLPAVRQEVVNSTVDMLHMYRSYCTRTTSPAQLILPESLKLLPIYISALLKCPVLRVNSGGQLDDLLRTDERCAELCRWRSLPVQYTTPTIYPRLFSLHDLADDVGTTVTERLDGATDAVTRVVLPPTLWPSAEKFSLSGVFLLCTPVAMFIYVGENASAEVLDKLFGAGAVSDIARVGELLRLRDNKLSHSVHAVVNELRKTMLPFVPIVIVTPQSPVKKTVTGWLVEDRVRRQDSYVELLCAFHAQIQSRMMY